MAADNTFIAKYPMGQIWPALTEEEKEQYIALAYGRLAAYGIRSFNDVNSVDQETAVAGYIRHCVDNEITTDNIDRFTVPEFVINLLSKTFDPDFVKGGDPVALVYSKTPVEAATTVDRGDDNVQSDWNVTDTESDAFIRNKPDLAPSNAEENIQANWTETDTNSDAFIKNKPTIPSDINAAVTEDDLAPISAEADRNSADIAAIKNQITDIHAGTPSTGWSDATADSQGGVALITNVATLENARNATGFEVSKSSGLPGKHAVFRLPVATDRRQARIVITSTAPVVTFTLAFSQLHLLGQSTDNKWNLYADPETAALGTADASIKLQLTGSAAHLGTSTYGGKLTGSIDDDLVGVDTLKTSNSPIAGQFLQYKDTTDKLTWATLTIPKFAKYADEASLPATVPAGTIAWYPE